jgi:rubredoxin
MKVLSPDQLRCPVTGKAAFASLEKAEEIIARGYTRKGPHKTGQGRELAKRAYECEHCGWYHLAHTHERKAA